MGVYLAGLFSLFSPVQIVLFVVLLGGLIALFIWGNTQKNKDSRAEMLQRKYYTLDAEKLAAIPDEELDGFVTLEDMVGYIEDRL